MTLLWPIQCTTRQESRHAVMAWGGGLLLFVFYGIFHAHHDSVPSGVIGKILAAAMLLLALFWAMMARRLPEKTPSMPRHVRDEAAHRAKVCLCLYGIIAIFNTVMAASLWSQSAIGSTIAYWVLEIAFYGEVVAPVQGDIPRYFVYALQFWFMTMLSWMRME